MNKNGSDIIAAIVQRLKDEDRLCYDSAIIAELRELDRYKLAQLINFGDVDNWIAERNIKLKGE